MGNLGARVALRQGRCGEEGAEDESVRIQWYTRRMSGRLRQMQNFMGAGEGYGRGFWGLTGDEDMVPASGFRKSWSIRPTIPRVQSTSDARRHLASSSTLSHLLLSKHTLLLAGRPDSHACAAGGIEACPHKDFKGVSRMQETQGKMLDRVALPDMSPLRFALRLSRVSTPEKQACKSLGVARRGKEPGPLW